MRDQSLQAAVGAVNVCGLMPARRVFCGCRGKRRRYYLEIMRWRLRARNACQQVAAGNDVGQPQMVLRAHGNASLLAEAAQGQVDLSQSAKATRRMRVFELNAFDRVRR